MNNYLHSYFDRTQVGRRDYFRQLVFLTFTPLSILLFLFHLLGLYGLTVRPALICSACYAIISAISLGIYLLKGPQILKSIMPFSLISLMVIQGVRLVTLANMGLQEPMLTTVNITICYILVLISSISMLPHTTLICTCIYISVMTFCRYLTHNPMYGQLLVMFGSISVATTIFGYVANRLLHEQQKELHDDANTIEQVLYVFNMRKTELLALLKLAKAKDATQYDKELMEQLDNKTLHNIIKVANQIEHMYANQRKEMRERFPMLTPTELDICRLVEQGLTLKEIANTLSKSVSNVSTVRGNIRKKLGLTQDDDLRTILLESQQ